MKVVYVGPADVRQLDAEDYAKYGVETEGGHTFTRGEPTEVNEDVADVLLGDRLLRQEFREYTPPPKPKKPSRAKAAEEDDEGEELDPTKVEQPPGHVENNPAASGDSEKAKEKPKEKAKRSS